MELFFIVKIAILIILSIIMGINVGLLIFTYISYGNRYTINNGWLDYAFKQIIKFGLVSFILLMLLFILFMIDTKLAID